MVRSPGIKYSFPKGMIFTLIMLFWMVSFRKIELKATISDFRENLEVDILGGWLKWGDLFHCIYIYILNNEYLGF